MGKLLTPTKSGEPLPHVVGTMDIFHDKSIDEVTIQFNEPEGKVSQYKMTLKRFREFVEEGATPLLPLSKDNHPNLLANLWQTLLQMEKV